MWIVEGNVGRCIISAYLQLFRQITSKTQGNRGEIKGKVENKVKTIFSRILSRTCEVMVLFRNVMLEI